jgi:hypothetical protein
VEINSPSGSRSPQLDGCLSTHLMTSIQNRVDQTSTNSRRGGVGDEANCSKYQRNALYYIPGTTTPRNTQDELPI